MWAVTQNMNKVCGGVSANWSLQAVVQHLKLPFPESRTMRELISLANLIPNTTSVQCNSVNIQKCPPGAIPGSALPT